MSCFRERHVRVIYVEPFPWNVDQHVRSRERTMFAPFKLKSKLARDVSVDLDDSLRAKKALKRIGYLEEPSYGITEYPDEPMFKAIEDFQQDHGLQRDGVMKPEGETARVLDKAVGFVETAGIDGNQYALAAKPKDNAEECYSRWIQEHAVCGKWKPYGDGAVRGCITRSNDRHRLCNRYGYPEPDDPKEWNLDDILGR